MAFEATHRITFIPDGISEKPTKFYVQLCAEDDIDGCGPAYTRREWKANIKASWELTLDGWRFQGHMTPDGLPGSIQVIGPLDLEPVIEERTQ